MELWDVKDKKTGIKTGKTHVRADGRGRVPHCNRHLDN